MKAYICNMFLKKCMSGLSATDKGRAAGKYRIRAFTLSLIASLFPYISQKPRGEDDDVLTPLSGVLPGSAGETRWKTLLPLAQAQSSIFKCFPVFLIFAVVAPSTCSHVPSLLFLVNPACTRWTAHPFIHTGHTHKVAVFKSSRAWSGNPVPPHSPVARLLTWYWWRSCDKRRSSYHFLFSLSASLFSSSAANARLSWGHEMS